MSASTLQALRESVDEYAVDCYDHTTHAKDVVYVGDKALRYRVPSTLFQREMTLTGYLSDYAYRQLNGRIGGPDIHWLEKKCPPDFEPEVFNRMLQQEAGKGREYLVRSKGDVVRAVLSDEYTVFDNSRFVGLFENHIDGAHAVVHRPSVDDHLRAYVLFPEIELSDKYGGLHLGVYIRNSEIGDGGAKIAGGLYRSVCTNGLVFGWECKEAMVFNHRYYDQSMMAAMIAAAMATALQMSEVAARLFVASESIHIEQKTVRPLLERYAKKYGVSKSVIDETVGATTGNAGEYGRAREPRLMDVVNAVTYVAQRQDSETFQEAMERMSGEILRKESGYRYPEAAEVNAEQLEMALV